MPTSRVEPRWLSAEDVIAINRDEVAETGEPFVVLDEGKLCGAVARPSMRWAYEATDDLAVLASSLLFDIAGSHAFAQGNKRTGFTAAAVFLELNGHTLDLGREGIEDALGPLIVAVIERRAAFDAFVACLGSCIVPHPPAGP